MPNEATSKRPVLCLVLDRGVARGDLATAVERAAAAGIDWLQIRDRVLSGADLLEFSLSMRRATERGSPGRAIEIIVNRRIDIALAMGADGAHLGFDAQGPGSARGLLPGAKLGISAHTPEEVGRGAAEGASYAHLAPIYAPISKRSTRSALGLSAIAAAAGFGIPVIAQGGLEPARCEEVIRAGAAGIAVTGAILQSDDPGSATAAMRDALDRAVT